ncbi:MAG: heme exporter protein CcmD [Rubrivivax sp.]|nr:heme exporter protein CcmD [Rubrivivax sp.]
MSWQSNWASWGDFLHMGGYGLYVWGSYAVTLAVMGTEAWAARRRRRRAFAAARAESEPENMQ